MGNTITYLNQQLYRMSILYDVSRGIHAELTMFYKQMNEFLCRAQYSCELRVLLKSPSISDGQAHAAFRMYSSLHPHRQKNRQQLMRWTIRQCSGHHTPRRCVLLRESKVPPDKHAASPGVNTRPLHSATRSANPTTARIA